MPRLCTVCASTARAQIDEDLIRHATSYRKIATQYDLSHDALMRHEHTHLHQSFRQNQEAQALMSAERLVTRIEQMDSAIDRVLAGGEAAGDSRLVLLAIREARLNCEALSRIAILHDLERRIALLEQPPVSEEDDGDHNA